MDRITRIIMAATYELERSNLTAAEEDAVTARDWAAFFKAISEFIAVLLPLLIPLFVKPATADLPPS